jgi:hypothetical protein
MPVRTVKLEQTECAVQTQPVEKAVQNEVPPNAFIRRHIPDLTSGFPTKPASGFYGVKKSGQRWRASAPLTNKHLGSFETKEQAAFAYDQHVESHLASGLTSATTPRNHLTINAAEEAAAQAKADYDTDKAKRMLANPPPRPASGFYGVTANGKRWKAQIRSDSKRHNLGTFDTKQEAALAYDSHARRCGACKPLNHESIAAAEEAAEQAQAEHKLVHPELLQPELLEQPRPASGFYGVYAYVKRWQAKIRYDSKQRFLGSFDTKQEAALAYDREARQCGEDKPLNHESTAAAEA